MDKISFIFFFASSSLPPASWKLLTWGWWLLSGRLPCGSRDFFFHLLFPLFCFALLCFAFLFLPHSSHSDFPFLQPWLVSWISVTSPNPSLQTMDPTNSSDSVTFSYFLLITRLFIAPHWYQLLESIFWPISRSVSSFYSDLFFFSGDLLAAFINQIFCCLFVFRDWFLFFFFFLLLCLFAVGPLFRFSAFLNHSGRFQSNRRRWFTVA